MDKNIKIVILFILTSCIASEKAPSDEFYKHDFQGSYQKYLVKEGLIKYEMITKDSLKADTTYIDLYFDHHGAKEYYVINRNGKIKELLKVDSLQYSKKESEHAFTFSGLREHDLLIEKFVINNTSKLYSGLYCGKRTNLKVDGKACERCNHAFFESSSKFMLTHFRGIPIECFSLIAISSSHDHETSIKTTEIDTNFKFPLILNIK